MRQQGHTILALAFVSLAFAIACLALVLALSLGRQAQGAESGDPRAPSFVGTYTSPPPAGPWSGASANIPSGTGISVVLPPASDDSLASQLLDWRRLWQQRLDQAAAAVAASLTFAFDSTVIEERWQERLDAVAAVLLDNPELCLSLEGHTDLVGGEIYNLELGYERAISVRDALVRRGVAVEQLRPASWGKEAPLRLVLAPAQENRRVELVPYLFCQEE